MLKAKSGVECEARDGRRGPAKALARGDPTLKALISPDDYPASAHRAGAGDRMVTLLLTVGSEGRVTGCRIKRSSGVASLDNAACRILSRRARFWPALDAAGKARVSTVKHKVRWKMPPPIPRTVFF